jgi:molybdate transport system substrate-binding protein
LRRTALIALFALLVALPAQTPAHAQDKTITVFAAASMKNALDDINAAFTKATGIKVAASLKNALDEINLACEAETGGAATISYAASSALAKQIEQGAPADVFASADLAWMDYLDKKKLIKAGTRFNLLGNKLVLIAPKDSKLSNVKIEQGFDIAKLAGDGRIAVADVRAVPAGKYAKAALEKLGSWAAAEKKLAPAENVRAALALVQRGEAPLGVVYMTDTRGVKDVKVVDTFPDDSHDPIVYPIGIVAGHSRPEVKGFFDFLSSDEGKALFKAYGFKILE